MKDREFNRLRIENTDGQIHASGDAGQQVKELPLDRVSEKGNAAESFRTSETGMTREDDWGSARSSGGGESASYKVETPRSTVHLVTNAAVATPITAAVAVVVSAVLVVTSIISAVSVKVSLRACTAFSLLFSLVIQNPENEPILATLSAQGEDDRERVLQTEGEESEKVVELAFEDLSPGTEYTLTIRNQSNDEKLFQKSYFTERGDGQKPIVYTVTPEEWNAALADDRFRNVTIRMTSAESENDQPSGSESEETIYVFADGQLYQVSGNWVDVRQIEDEEFPRCLQESCHFLSELTKIPFENFTYDESAHLYRFTRRDEEGEQESEQDQQFSSTSYALEFRNGYLTVVEITSESVYGEQRWSYTQHYAFGQYGTSTVKTAELDGVKYAASPTTDTLTAYGTANNIPALVTIPAEIGGRTVTTIAAYCFGSDQNLNGVILPATLTYVGYNFSNCNNLSGVYYLGSPERWDEIAADMPRNVSVYFYSETKPAGSPTAYWHYDDGQPILWEEETAPVDENTVSQEEWDAALSGGSFRNVTISSVSQENSVQSNYNESTTTVFADGKMIRYESDSVDFRECDGESFSEYLFNSFPILSELAEIGFGNFTYDATSGQYRFVSVTQSDPDPTQSSGTQQSVSIIYTAGFFNGRLIYLNYSIPSENETHTIDYYFDSYNTSSVTVEEIDGVRYVASSAIDELIAYEWILTDEPMLDVTIYPEIGYRSVTQIAQELFTDRPELNSVILPDTLTYVGFNFEKCPSLSGVYYLGTPEQWQKIILNHSDEPNVSSDVPVYFFAESKPAESPAAYWHYDDDGQPILWEEEETDPVEEIVYTVSQEEWNESLAEDNFRNVTINSSVQQNSVQTVTEPEKTIIFANERMVWYQDHAIELRTEAGGDNFPECLQEQCPILAEIIGIGFENFTYHEDSTFYEYVSESGADPTQQSSPASYFVQFMNGHLVYAQYDYSVNDTSYSEFYFFEEYGASFVIVEESSGLLYVASSYNNDLIACEWTENDEPVTDVVVPDQISERWVTEIAPNLFTDRPELNSVILPESLIYLGPNFEQCSNLTGVYYLGTSDEWAAIATEVPTSVPVYFYAETMPDESPSDYWHYEDSQPVRWSV